MSVIDEINRGKEYSRSLRKLHSCSKTKIEPTYKPLLDKQDKHLYRDVFVERCIVPDYVPNYDKCRHIKRNIVNRDELDIKQHINLLAQPKFVPEKKMEKPYIVKRKVPGPTPRILELARPNKRKTLETCKQYAATMPKYCIQNCYRNVQDVAFVPVREAVYFIKSKTSKTILEKRKLKRRMNHLQEKIKEAKMAMMKEINEKLYSSLKTHLLTPVEKINDDQIVKLSKVIRNKLCKLLNIATELVEDVFMDRFIVHISDKLSIWMIDLLYPKRTALKNIVTEPITQDATVANPSTSTNAVLATVSSSVTASATSTINVPATVSSSVTASATSTINVPATGSSTAIALTNLVSATNTVVSATVYTSTSTSNP